MPKKPQLYAADDVVLQKITALHTSPEARAIFASWDECCESIARNFERDDLPNSARHARNLKESP